jgi:hypothetical protein
MSVESGRVKTASLHEEFFVLIVGSNLSCIDDGVAHNIGGNTNPEAKHAILGNDLLVAVGGALVDMLSLGETALGLKTDLHDIGGVSDRDTNGTSGHTSHNLLEESGVNSRLKGSSNHITDGDVQANTETSEENLALEAGNQTIEQSLGAFLSGNFTHGAEKSLVAGLLTRSSVLELKTNLGGVNRDGGNFTNRPSE